MSRLALKLLTWVGIPAGGLLVSTLCFDGVTQQAFSDGDLSAQMVRITRDVRLQRHRNAELQRELVRRAGRYIVVDTKHNRLRLCEAGHTLREMPCATGSNRSLTYRWWKWTFSTPLGRFRVERKEERPVWIKPDWAFVEVDEPVPPPAESSERFEAGVLGPYALHFEEGYMIHGTLYENRIGQSVTHGCVRLRHDDLEYLYSQADVGTPIYIY